MNSKQGGKWLSLPLTGGRLPAAFCQDRQNTMALPSLIVSLSFAQVGKFPEPFPDGD
ncbi:MAG: hypothetical protein RIE73_18265 [Coleofasciculus sp. C1-SOL-03]|uniref:hypothetical protein n=1 Tax=Coleofasciculus sp. C1-SOL-03 TaxID=3069522 RepID=UPI0032F69210